LGATLKSSPKNDYWLKITAKIIFLLNFERYLLGSKNEFRRQVLGLGTFPYRYFEVPKVSRKSGADSCGAPLSHSHPKVA